MLALVYIVELALKVRRPSDATWPRGVAVAAPPRVAPRIAPRVRARARARAHASARARARVVARASRGLASPKPGGTRARDGGCGRSRYIGS